MVYKDRNIKKIKRIKTEAKIPKTYIINYVGFKNNICFSRRLVILTQETEWKLFLFNRPLKIEVLDCFLPEIKLAVSINSSLSDMQFSGKK